MAGQVRRPERQGARQGVWPEGRRADVNEQASQRSGCRHVDRPRTVGSYLRRHRREVVLDERSSVGEDGGGLPIASRVLPRWEDIALQDIGFDDLQVWISSLSVGGSVRFEGKGLSASRVRQAHQLVGAVRKFAVKAEHLAKSPAEEMDLPPVEDVEQKYLTHEQLHRLAVASGRLRTLALVLG